MNLKRNANLFNKSYQQNYTIKKKDIADKIVSTRAILDNQKSLLYSKALAYNAKIVSMNAEIDIIESQLADFT